MKFTRYIISTTAAVLIFGAVTFNVFGNNAESTTTPKPALDTELFSKGEYLVHDLAMCIDCHSPRGKDGAFIAGSHLTGSPLGFTPSVPMAVWAPVAPPIAGLPKGWSQEDMVTYLMSGLRPHNLPPTMPPMPSYRMNETDAKAVAYYLKAIGG